MDLSFKKYSCISFVIVVDLLFVFASSFQDSQYLRHDFSKDHLINATNTRLFEDYNYDNDDLDWIRRGDECSKDNIYISQGQTTPLPDGIPTYTVQIQNICMPPLTATADSCSIGNIHLSCGWFSSARLINPDVFRRISFDDCLVNNGDPISPGQTITFQYANTYPYPLSVSSVSCY